MDVLNILEDYASESDDNQIRRHYLYWSPGSYSYLFVPNQESFEFIANRIDGPTYFRRFGRILFQRFSLFPWFSRLVPTFSKHELSVPSQNQYDLVIVGSHIKIFNFEKNVITTLKQNKEDFDTQISIRQCLPESINVPNIYSYNEEFPYYTEELISGREINDPIAEWPLVEIGLTQLRPLYKRDREWYSISKIRSEVDTQLRDLGLHSHSTIQQGLKILNTLNLPKGLYIGTVHGDFHTGNLIVSDDVYIVDWDKVRQLPLMADFFKIFIQYYVNTGSEISFLQMITATGEVWNIFGKYAKSMGETVYGTTQAYTGLPLLYLLYMVSQSDTKKDALDNIIFDLLEDIVCHLIE